MKIDATLPLPAWSDVVENAQPTRKAQPPGTTKSGPDSEKVVQNLEDSKELSRSTGTYSPASLKAAAVKNALYPEVAENNRSAINHTSPIPRAILDRLNQLVTSQ
jgi:hypothetical protein